MYKKLLTLFFVFVLSTALGGCTIAGVTFDLPNIPYLSNLFPSNNESKEANITYWSLFEPAEIYDSAIVSYQNKNPGVKVNFEQRVTDNLDTYKDSLLAKLKSGEASPDIMRVHITWLSDFKPYIEPAGTNIISSETFKSRFYKPAFDMSVIDSKVYAIPLTYDSLVLLYNKDIFSANNVSAPTTWSDFKTLSEKLTTKSTDQKIDVAGAALGSADNVAHFSDILGLLINQSEINLPADMESKQMKDIIIFYTNFIKTSKVWDRSFAYSPLSFASGKVAMMFAPSWQLLNILASNPNINIGVAAVPQLVSEDTLTSASYPNFWVEVVNKNSKAKVASWEFLNYLSSKEQQQAVFNTAQLKRAFGEPYSDTDLQSELSSNPYLNPVYTNADQGRVLKITDLSGNTPYVQVLKNVVEGVLNGGDIDALLKTAKSEYERLESAK